MNDDVIFDWGFKIGDILLQTVKNVVEKGTNFHEL